MLPVENALRHPDDVWPILYGGMFVVVGWLVGSGSWSVLVLVLVSVSVSVLWSWSWSWMVVLVLVSAPTRGGGTKG